VNTRGERREVESEALGGGDEEDRKRRIGYEPDSGKGGFQDKLRRAKRGSRREKKKEKRINRQDLPFSG